MEKINRHIHELKIDPEYWRSVSSLDKKAEIRNNDRDYQAGDLIRFIPTNDREAMREFLSSHRDDERMYIITHVLHFPEGLREGYVSLSIEHYEMWKSRQEHYFNPKCQ